MTIVDSVYSVFTAFLTPSLNCYGPLCVMLFHIGLHNHVIIMTNMFLNLFFQRL
jgi:hypothetical protein